MCATKERVTLLVFATDKKFLERPVEPQNPEKVSVENQKEEKGKLNVGGRTNFRCCPLFWKSNPHKTALVACWSLKAVAHSERNKNTKPVPPRNSRELKDYKIFGDLQRPCLG